MPKLELRQSSWHWWAVTIVAALTFFGHDALMATDAHAAPAATANHDANHQPSNHDTEIRVDEVAGRFTPGHQPHRSDACEVARPIVLPNAPEFETVAHAATTVTLRATEQPRSHPTRSIWEQPTAPPGVRRALIQVFLI